MNDVKVGDECRACGEGIVDTPPSPWCGDCRKAAAEWYKEKLIKSVEPTFAREWEGTWSYE